MELLTFVIVAFLSILSVVVASDHDMCGMGAHDETLCGISLLQQRAKFQLADRSDKEVGAIESKRMTFGKHSTSSKGIVRLLDFSKAKILLNNLGGQGPWKTQPNGESAPEEIRIGDLVQGQNLDLVIKTEGTYIAHNVSRNGILDGNFQINARSGSTVTLHFTFVEAGTDTPHEMPLFYITFSDLDERHGGPEKEMISVDGFTKYYTNDDLDIVGKNSTSPTFESVDYGNYADNDMHPDSPDPLQLTHAVTFSFTNKASFRATYIVTQDGDDVKGRNILFSGISQLVFCQEPSTFLDFKTAVVQANNLGGKGPKFGTTQEIRFANIGTFGGETIDLVAAVEKNVDAHWDYHPWNVSQNGIRGEFGIVNLFSGVEKTDSEAHLVFKIVKGGTELPVVLDAFAFMLFDFDAGLHEQQIEYVDMAPNPPGFQGGSGYASYLVTKSTELNVTKQEDGGIRFMATEHGTEADNPKTSQMLARKEADRSVVFTFRKTSEFKLTFGITPNGYNTGRNLMFAGQDMYMMCD